MKLLMTKQHKNLILILSALVVAVVCAGAAEIVSRKIYKDEHAFRHVVFSDGSEAFNVRNCEITDNTLTVTGSDPQFTVSAHNQVFSRVRIAFRKPTEQEVSLQLFYVPTDGSLSEKNSVDIVIGEGKTQELIYIPGNSYEYLRFDFEQDVAFEGIYIGDREWSLRPYRPTLLRIIISFAIVFLPLFLLILKQKRGTGTPAKGKKRKPNPEIVLCNLFLSLTVLFFQPLDQILVNPQFYPAGIGNIWLKQLLIAIGVAVILSLLMHLLPGTPGIIASAVSLGAGVAFLAQSLLFNENRILRMDTNWPMEMLNIHVWFGIILLTAALAACNTGAQEKGKRATAVVLCAVAWILIVMQTVNFTVLATVPDTSVSVASVESQGQYQSEDIQSILTISKERGLPFLMK